MRGKVYLVGAGVGGKDLLTVRAAKVIAEVDVIVYDRLVDPSILELVKPGAEVIYMGKKPGDDSAIQNEIIKTILEKADEGKTVARLKSGDPFIFGRGGEELLALKSADLSFEVITGLTSAVAIPTLAGIPLTMRDLSSSILILTGHRASPEEESYFTKYAKFDGTIVLLMAKRNLSKITQQFIEGKMNPEKPAVAISLTEKGLTTVFGTVGSIAEKMGAEADSVVVVIGDVVQKAMGGRKVLLTSLDLADVSKFLNSGFTPVAVPVIRLVANHEEVQAFLDALKSELFESVVFMSPRAVDMINFDGETLRYLSRANVYAIGPSTKRSLEAKGVHVRAVPSDFSSVGLFGMLVSVKGEVGRIALLRSAFADDSLSERLRNAGLAVTEFKIYRPERDEVHINSFYSHLMSDVYAVVFTSRSSVHYLMEYFRDMGVLDELLLKLKKVRTLCLGSETAKALMKFNLAPEVAEIHTLDGVLLKLREGVNQ